MGDIRCMIRRHRWDSRHNPEVEGPKGDYQTCARCGEDKAGYEPPPKNMYRGVWGKGRIGLPRRGRVLPKGTRGAMTVAMRAGLALHFVPAYGGAEERHCVSGAGAGSRMP